MNPSPAIRISFCELLIFLALNGCAPETVPTVRYAGSVSYQGQPVAEGGISFTPLGAGKAAWVPITNGTYIADAVPKGRVRVQVSALQKTGKTYVRDGATIEEQLSIVPDKLRRGIEMSVLEDRTDFDFNLSE